MSILPVHYQKRPAAIGSVFFPFLRQLNMGTVASILTIALALLSIARSKEPSGASYWPTP